MTFNSSITSSQKTTSAKIFLAFSKPAPVYTLPVNAILKLILTLRYWPAAMKHQH